MIGIATRNRSENQAIYLLLEKSIYRCLLDLHFFVGTCDNQTVPFGNNDIAYRSRYRGEKGILNIAYDQSDILRLTGSHALGNVVWLVVKFLCSRYDLFSRLLADVSIFPDRPRYRCPREARLFRNVIQRCCHNSSPAQMYEYMVLYDTAIIFHVYSISKSNIMSSFINASN